MTACPVCYQPVKKTIRVNTDCPVCYQPVKKTIWGNIHSHWDSAHRDICPASGYPFEIAINHWRNAKWGTTA